MGSAVVGSADAWQARAAAWELAALSMRYPGDGVLAQVVASGEWIEAARELSDRLGLGLPQGWDADLAGLVGGCGDPTGPGGLVLDLRVEATRLFVGSPNPAVSPYEGVWRAAEEGVDPLLFVNPHSIEVEGFTRSCGLGHPAGANEPLDHVATECELLSYMALHAASAAVGAPAEGDDAMPGGSAASAYGRFLAEHVRLWIPGFADKVAACARHPFFRAAGAYLGALARAL